MKKLFCTVVTDYDGQLESPIIYHTKCETKEQAEVHVHEELVEYGYDVETIDETFDIFSFEITERDIVEL